MYKNFFTIINFLQLKADIIIKKTLRVNSFHLVSLQQFQNKQGIEKNILFNIS